VENLGIRKGSTHMKGNKKDFIYLSKKRDKLKFPLIHPVKIIRDEYLDNKLVRRDSERILMKKINNLIEIWRTS